MSLPSLPMQLLPTYHAQLKSRFLTWYRLVFTSPRRVYGHWTAGGCGQDDKVYHDVVAVNPLRKAVLFANTPVNIDTFAHTYHRNTGSWSICFAGFGDATPSSLGTMTVTPGELRLFVDTLAGDCVNQRVQVANFMSHGEAADNMDFPTPADSHAPHEPYGPTTTCERWDLCCAINPHDLSLHPNCLTRARTPSGLEFLPDWIRGQAALQIQTDTKSKWS